MTSWWKWRDTVVEQVRFFPDRAKIAEELDAHYEDHVKDLERIGFTHNLAEERALKAMGDAEEVGKAMDKAHRPGLGWLWLVSKWSAIVCIASMVLMLFSGNWQSRFKEPAQREGDYEPNGFHYFGEGSWEYENSERIMTGKGASTVVRDGDVFSVPYAAVWKTHYPGDNEAGDGAFDSYWITVVLAADDKNPFDFRYGDFGEYLVLTHDDGRFYTNDYGVIGIDESGKAIRGPGDGTFNGGLYARDPFRSLYYKRQFGAKDPPGEWSELSYPNGEPWSIRIEWEEVEP